MNSAFPPVTGTKPRSTAKTRPIYYVSRICCCVN
jgi:hypothetical protein